MRTFVGTDATRGRNQILIRYVWMGKATQGGRVSSHRRYHVGEGDLSQNGILSQERDEAMRREDPSYEKDSFLVEEKEDLDLRVSEASLIPYSSRSSASLDSKVASTVMDPSGDVSMEQVIVHGSAWKVVTGWMGITEEEADKILMEGDVSGLEAGRPARLGLGAKFLAHNKVRKKTRCFFA